MQEATANTIGNNLDTNPSDQKLLAKKQRALLRRERIRKYREQLGFFEDDDYSTSSSSTRNK
jgi:hypothetical protein